MLTDSQLKLIEDNYNVIFAVLKKYSLPASEYYDVCAERLCLAARSFQGNSGNFFSYAYKAVYRAAMTAVHRKHPYPEDIDEMPIAGPDAYAEVEDKQYQTDILRICKPIMTPAELRAVKRIMAGESSHTQAESGARNRALKKLRAYLRGEQIKTVPNLVLTREQREERDKHIIEMRAHGYDYQEVADACEVSGRLVRQIYANAGRPQYRTSADFARLLGVDRSTVLRHATARKEGRTWRIDEIHYRKKYPKFSKAYTKDEIEFIRSHPYWTAQEIADKIGRSANSVRIKRCRMKI